MALRERIFSIETEYGIMFYKEGQADGPSPEEQIGTLINVLKKGYGFSESDFLVNGSKFHYDIGHPEWALPECRSPREATAYDRAADRSLKMALPEARRRLKSSGHRGQLIVFKNNVDSFRNSFGCHENYLMLREAELLVGGAFQRYIVRCLVPFLVTRQLYCGAGRLIIGEDGKPPSFHLSQRTEFIEFIVSSQTIYDRAIVNFSREKEPHASERYRRLHLILGDSNLSGWATWMKLGTTGLLLRLIEDLYLQDIPLLADPIEALQEVSGDLTAKRPLRLRDGREATAVEIQWRYYDAVSEYVDLFGASDEEEELLASWQHALEDLERDPMLLRDRADWAIKKNFMDAHLRKKGTSWDDEDFPPEGLAALKGVEARYHDISDEGMYSQLVARYGSEDTLVSKEEIDKAQQMPPPFTRASVRGYAIDRLRHGEKIYEVKDWKYLFFKNERIEMDDPLQFIIPPLRAESYFEQTLAAALSHGDSHVRLRALEYLGWSRTPDALRLLIRVIETEQDEQIRQAAVEAVGKQGLQEGLAVLIHCLQDRAVSVRWAAEAALQQMSEPLRAVHSRKQGDQPKGDDSSPGYDTTLVNIIS